MVDGATLGDTLYSILKFLAAREPRAQGAHLEVHLDRYQVLEQGFSALASLTLWPDNFLAWGCRVHCSMFSSTPHLFSLDASSNPQL